MAGRMLRRMIYVHFLIICLMMVLCLLIVGADCANRASGGEFRLLPALNFGQFKGSGILEEDGDAIVRAVAYEEQLYANGHGPDDPLWHFINVSTTIALCNFLLYCSLRLFNIRFPHWSLRLVQIACGIALLLIFAARIYVRIYARNSYGACWVEEGYPIAFLTLGELMSKLFIPVLILSILVGIKKLLRKE